MGGSLDFDEAPFSSGTAIQERSRKFEQQRGGMNMEKGAAREVQVTSGVETERGQISWDLSHPASPRFAVLTAASMVFLHGLVWAWIAWRRHQPIGHLLSYWDAAYYSSIAREGYHDALWAFYPAYPFLVRTVAKVLGTSEVQWVGALVSSALLLLFVLCCALAFRHETAAGLTPRTRLGWLCLLFAPASYTLHSHHTEALFLLLSFLSFFFSATKRPLLGGAFGALCAMTRNQGVFVCLTTTLLCAWGETGPRQRLRAALGSGLLCLAGVGGFLLFEKLAAGNALAFMDAQHDWTHANSPLTVLRTLVLANPWQSRDPANLVRYVCWWGLVLGSLGLMRIRPVLGLYGLLSMLVILLQGELVNTLRFTTPVFPLLFFLGDACARRSRVLQGLFLGVLFVGNLALTRSYGLGEWAY
jgi:hypothetical protein